MNSITVKQLLLVEFYTVTEFMNGQRLLYQSSEGYLLGHKNGAWMVEEPSHFCQPSKVTMMYPTIETPSCHNTHTDCRLYRVGSGIHRFQPGGVGHDHVCTIIADSAPSNVCEFPIIGNRGISADIC